MTTNLPFHFSIQTHPTTRVISVSGEFDVATCGRFTAAVESLQAAGRGDVAVHLDEVTFLDAAALGAIVAACASQVARGDSLGVHGIPPAQRRVFDLGGLAHLITEHRWVRAAWFGRPAVLPLSA